MRNFSFSESLSRSLSLEKKEISKKKMLKLIARNWKEEENFSLFWIYWSKFNSHKLINEIFHSVDFSLFYECTIKTPAALSTRCKFNFERKKFLLLIPWKKKKIWLKLCSHPTAWKRRRENYCNFLLSNEIVLLSNIGSYSTL